MPGYVPIVLLLAFEAAAFLGSIVARGRARPDRSAAAHRCSRCVRLHARSESFGRAADAAAVGALAFLVALPFTAAGYESGFSFANLVLGASALVAVVALAAEADFLARAAAAFLWPRLTWSVAPARIVGGGARWLGALIALYAFQPRDAGIGGLFGSAGARVIADLGSPWPIATAAAILVGACWLSLAARWLAPIVFGSQPVVFAARRDPHGAAG